MQRENFAVPVKLWASGCAIVGISMTSNTVLTCILALTGFLYLSVQHNWRALRSFGVFYTVMAVLLYLIRYQGLHMVVFSEFYVLMFWNLFAGILGLLVMFRFFPTMKAELKSVWLSMRNRGLTAPAKLLLHPVVSCEYVLVPLLLRCLQIADQLSVSAVARGAEAPGKRGSYYEKDMTIKDWSCLILWSVVTFLFLWIGGVRA